MPEMEIKKPDVYIEANGDAPVNVVTDEEIERRKHGKDQTQNEQG